jgi:hypothetical protein
MLLKPPVLCGVLCTDITHAFRNANNRCQITEIQLYNKCIEINSQATHQFYPSLAPRVPGDFLNVILSRLLSNRIKDDNI